MKPTVLKRFLATAFLGIATWVGSSRSAVADCCTEIPQTNNAIPVYMTVWSSPDTFFTYTIQGGPIPDGTYGGWCIDSQDSIDPSQGYTVPGTTYTGALLSTCDTNELALLPTNHICTPPVGPPPMVPLYVWHELNYLINHRPTNDIWDVQVAINSIIGGPPIYNGDGNPNDVAYPTIDTNIVQGLINAAVSNAPAWQSQCGDKVAIVYVVNNGTNAPEQLTILEVPCRCCTITFTTFPTNCDLGCNPASIPVCQSPVPTNLVNAVSSCSNAVTITCSSQDSTINCKNYRTFTYIATDGSGASATNSYTVSWTTDTTTPIITSTPLGGWLGCNPQNLPADSNILAAVVVSNTCSVPTVTVTHVDSGTPCAMTRTFTITATDACGKTAAPVTVIYTYKIDTTPPNITCPPDVSITPTNNTTSTNVSLSGYCGYTQGGWGSVSNGNNPGAILAANFSAMYPAGSVTIGLPGTGYSLTYTSALAIQKFLPSGGTPKALTSSATNSTSSCGAGVFAGQVLALELNLDHSALGSSPIGSLVLNDASSPLNGKTIAQILAIANTALGGGNISGYNLSISSLNNLVTSLNEAFDNCTPSSYAVKCLQQNQTTTTNTVSTLPSSTGYPTVTDNCDSAPVITYSDNTVAGPCPGSTIIYRTWTAVDSCGNSNSCTQTIVVGCTLSQLTLGCAGGIGQVNVAYSSSFPVSGGVPPYTFSIVSGKLPTGLTLNPTNGTVSGLPTAAGTFNFTVQVQDSSATASSVVSNQCGITINGCTVTTVTSGDTATIGFWHNSNGQALIDSMNGGGTNTALGNWLATSFPSLYGTNSTNNLTGKNNSAVAALFMKFFAEKGQNTDAQIMAGALASYVTDSVLAGTSAGGYGFNVSATGTGAKTYNVGGNGTAIGLQNNTAYTVLQLLQQANLDKQNGTFNATAFNDIFDGINQTGDIK